MTCNQWFILSRLHRRLPEEKKTSREERNHIYAAILMDPSYHFHGTWRGIQLVCSFDEFCIIAKVMKMKNISLSDLVNKN